MPYEREREREREQRDNEWDCEIESAPRGDLRSLAHFLSRIIIWDSANNLTLALPHRVHIDACWGGHTLVSKKHRHLMNGCESVRIIGLLCSTRS